MTHSRPTSLPAPQPNSVIDLDTAWIYKLSVLSRLVGERVATALQAVGAVNLSQWRVLAAVADTPGRSASEVVSVTPMDKGLVSRAVASLVSEGLLEKSPREDDRRASSLFLTPQGVDLYDRIVSRIAVEDADGTRALPPALQARLLDDLADAIRHFSRDIAMTSP